MVVTKAELIGLLQNEVRILVHLAGKVEPRMVEYRPTAKQRSTLELLRYLTVMGPQLLKAAKAGTFDPAAWTEATKAAEARNFDRTVEALASQRDTYAALLHDWTDNDFWAEVEIFGNKSTRGAFVINMVLSGHAAYRTQLFLYLKACGREGLGTANLWAGVDPPAPA